MAAPDQDAIPGEDGPPPARLFATALPTLRPRMLWPWRRREGLPFPFGDPSVRYFHFARNGVFSFGRLLDLSGHEVLFPSYFHGVELEALLAAGVRVRFYPVGRGMTVDPAAVSALVGPDTRAIYVIHYAGFPGPVQELSALCRERGLLLIEDCALSLLSRLGDRPLGSFGDAAVFCFYKTVPTPNGGAVTVRPGLQPASTTGVSPSLASMAAPAASSLLRSLELRIGTPVRIIRTVARSVGRAVVAGVRQPVVAPGTRHFDPAHASLSMGNLSHVVLRSQDFPAIVRRRRRNYTRLLDQLGDVAPPLHGELAPGVCPLCYPVRTRNKAQVVARLRRHGVEAWSFWPYHHPELPAGTFPEADELRRTVLWLPCHQDLAPSAMDRIATVARQILEPIDGDDAPVLAQLPQTDDPVQEQLDAYNARDLERFLACYAPDVVVEDGAGNVELRGLEAMRSHYDTYFAETPKLRCRVVRRIRVGEYVIDDERIRSGGLGETRLTAIYRVNTRQIVHVRFLYDQPKRWRFWNRS